MTLDLLKFYEATDPTITLDPKNKEHQKYYINFSAVRGGKIIEELKDKITYWSAGKPTCQLFTGYIGCGKSTELLRLKAELEQEGFQVVDFAITDDVDMGDIDVGDILLAIARQVLASLEILENIEIKEPQGLWRILRGAAQVLQTELDISAQATLPGIGKLTASTEGDEGIGKILIAAKESPEVRSKLREYLGPRTPRIIELINDELLVPFEEKLKQHDKKGLVVIVDNLDRVENIQKSFGRLQPEYLFVDRGEELRKLKCHVVYTMPLALMFSNEHNRLTARFRVEPKVLPMIPVKLQNGEECTEGMALLRQMVLARAFPDVEDRQRLGMVEEVFDSPETLERLCLVSGGHIRNVLMLLNQLIVKNRQLPLSREGLENVIKARCNQMKLAVEDKEWDLLSKIQESKAVTGDEGYRVLLRSMFVYEYNYENDSWFDINPILAEAGSLKC